MCGEAAWEGAVGVLNGQNDPNPIAYRPLGQHRSPPTPTSK
jgi:hypothetical protein